MTFTATAQSSSDSEKTSLFFTGIALHTPKTFIPWGTAFSEIRKYGNPKVFCSTRTNTKVVWDSVYILDSVRVTLTTFYFKCFEKKSPTGKLNTIYGFLDSADIPKVRLFLDKYTNTQAQVIDKGKGQYGYSWRIDDCNVTLGYTKKQKAYFNIQTQDFSYWR